MTRGTNGVRVVLCRFNTLQFVVYYGRLYILPGNNRLFSNRALQTMFETFCATIGKTTVTTDLVYYELLLSLGDTILFGTISEKVIGLVSTNDTNPDLMSKYALKPAGRLSLPLQLGSDLSSPYYVLRMGKKYLNVCNRMTHFMLKYIPSPFHALSYEDSPMQNSTEYYQVFEKRLWELYNWATYHPYKQNNVHILYDPLHPQPCKLNSSAFTEMAENTENFKNLMDRMIKTAIKAVAPTLDNVIEVSDIGATNNTSRSTFKSASLIADCKGKGGIKVYHAMPHYVIYKYVLGVCAIITLMRCSGQSDRYAGAIEFVSKCAYTLVDSRLQHFDLEAPARIIDTVLPAEPTLYAALRGYHQNSSTVHREASITDPNIIAICAIRMYMVQDMCNRVADRTKETMKLIEESKKTASHEHIQRNMVTQQLSQGPLARQVGKQNQTLKPNLGPAVKK